MAVQSDNPYALANPIQVDLTVRKVRKTATTWVNLRYSPSADQLYGEAFGSYDDAMASQIRPGGEITEVARAVPIEVTFEI